MASHFDVLFICNFVGLGNGWRSTWMVPCFMGSNCGGCAGDSDLGLGSKHEVGSFSLPDHVISYLSLRIRTHSSFLSSSSLLAPSIFFCCIWIYFWVSAEGKRGNQFIKPIYSIKIFQSFTFCTFQDLLGNSEYHILAWITRLTVVSLHVISNILSIK